MLRVQHVPPKLNGVQIQDMCQNDFWTTIWIGTSMVDWLNKGPSTWIQNSACSWKSESAYCRKATSRFCPAINAANIGELSHFGSSCRTRALTQATLCRVMFLVTYVTGSVGWVFGRLTYVVVEVNNYEAMVMIDISTVFTGRIESRKCVWGFVLNTSFVNEIKAELRWAEQPISQHADCIWQV